MFKLRYQSQLLIQTALIGCMCLASAASVVAAPLGDHVLRYDATNTGPVPIPSAERGLQTVVAEPFFKVTDQDTPLEGPAFDRHGHLLLTDVRAGRILRLDEGSHLTTVLEKPGIGIGGLAVHKDGRIFAAAAGDFTTGQIGVVTPGSASFDVEVPTAAGFAPNDLVFDADGGYYFTDFRGGTTEATGGVYYVAPGSKIPTQVLAHLARANGIALSPDGRVLWVGEFATNRLIRIELKDAATPTDLGTAVAYNFIGPAPDSMRTDAEGNLYVAIYGQGRVMAFNETGIPIGQILLPGRDDGHNLQTTSMALKPGTDEIYIVSNDGPGGEGASIFRARAFATALPLYSHQPR